jgi:hypothetical protein
MMPPGIGKWGEWKSKKKGAVSGDCAQTYEFKTVYKTQPRQLRSMGILIFDNRGPSKAVSNLLTIIYDIIIIYEFVAIEALLAALRQQSRGFSRIF